jgi:phosphoglycolate phosphatase-like HAD superfamily hydrolase
MKIKVIILDFDGVIVESNNIKHQAFSEIFGEYPQHYDEMMSYHLSNNHVNRYDKFRHIISKILNEKPDENRINEMARKFSNITREKIINCPFVNGAKEFLDEFFLKKFSLYIASATPIDELKIILEKKKLDKYFKGIYGAPVPKKTMFSEIIKKEQVNPDQVIFIGDSPEDYQVAKETGIHFIGKIGDYNFKDLNITSFDDMIEIKKYLSNEVS